MPWETLHFRSTEFLCKCGCGLGDRQEDVDRVLLAKLESIRQLLGMPMIITSGCRCSDWNDRIGGSRRSSHLKGAAADVRVNDSEHRYKIVEAAYGVGIQWLEVCDRHVHIDVDPTKPGPRLVIGVSR